MKINEKIFHIEINEEEIRVIIDSLNHCYKEMKNAGNTGTDEIHQLRNDFGDLLNIHFLGEDS